MIQTARDFAPIDSLAVMYSTTPEVAANVARELGDLLPAGEVAIRHPFRARSGDLYRPRSYWDSPSSKPGRTGSQIRCDGDTPIFIGRYAEALLVSARPWSLLAVDVHPVSVEFPCG